MKLSKSIVVNIIYRCWSLSLATNVCMFDAGYRYINDYSFGTTRTQEDLYHRHMNIMCDKMLFIEECLFSSM